MESIDDLIGNEWTTKYMANKKGTAKMFRAFNRQYFENKIAKNSEESQRNAPIISESTLDKIYELHNFTRKINNEKLKEEDRKRVEELNKLISYINMNYDNAFDKYIEKQKDLSLIKPKDIKEEHIIKLHKNFYRHHTMSKINFLITDMNSTIAYFKQKTNKKKDKEYHSDLRKIENQYYNITFLINCLKDQNDIEEHELKQIANKEKFMSDNIGQILNIIKQEKKIEKRKKRFSIVRKTVSMLAIIAALWQIGNFSYYNRDQIKEYYDKNIKPKIIA